MDKTEGIYYSTVIKDYTRDEFKEYKNDDVFKEYIETCNRFFNIYKNKEIEPNSYDYNEKLDNIVFFIKNNPDIDLYFPTGYDEPTRIIDENNNYKYFIVVYNDILKQAVVNGHTELVKILLDKVKENKKKELINKKYFHHDTEIRKDSNIYDPPTYSLLEFAFENKNQKMFEFLLEKGADLSECGCSLLEFALNYKLIEIFNFLLDKGADLSKCDCSLLNKTFIKSDMKMFNFLLDKGADLSKCGGLLDITLKKKDLKMFKFLLDKGANINYTDTNSLDTKKNKNKKIPENDLHGIMSKYYEYKEDNNNNVNITEFEKQIGEIVENKFNSEKNSFKMPDKPRESSPDTRTAEDIFYKHLQEKPKNGEEPTEWYLFKKDPSEKDPSGKVGGKRKKKRTIKKRKTNKKKRTTKSALYARRGSHYNNKSKKSAE